MRKTIKNAVTKTLKIQKHLLAKNKRYYWDYTDEKQYYSRAEAFENSFLVDLATIAPRYRLNLSVAATASLYIYALLFAQEAVENALWAIKNLNVKHNPSTIEQEYSLEFEVPIDTKIDESRRNESEYEWENEDDFLYQEFVYGMLKIKAVYHRGDHNEPVITLRYPDEPWDRRR